MNEKTDYTSKDRNFIGNYEEIALQYVAHNMIKHYK